MRGSVKTKNKQQCNRGYTMGRKLPSRHWLPNGEMSVSLLCRTIGFSWTKEKDGEFFEDAQLLSFFTTTTTTTVSTSSTWPNYPTNWTFLPVLHLIHSISKQMLSHIHHHNPMPLIHHQLLLFVFCFLSFHDTIFLSSCSPLSCPPWLQVESPLSWLS